MTVCKGEGKRRGGIVAVKPGRKVGKKGKRGKGGECIITIKTVKLEEGKREGPWSSVWKNCAQKKKEKGERGKGRYPSLSSSTVRYLFVKRGKEGGKSTLFSFPKKKGGRGKEKEKGGEKYRVLHCVMIHRLDQAGRRPVRNESN